MLNTFTWSFCHLSGVSSLESPCPFGFIGFSSGTSKSILHPSLPSETKLNNLIACGHTCVNGFDRVAAAISGLSEAVRSLAFELSRARRPVTLEAEEADLGEEQTFVRGVPVGFNSTIRFQVEEGPPPTPAFFCFCWQRRSSVQQLTAQRIEPGRPFQQDIPALVRSV